MLLHDLRLALLSFKRNPMLTALMGLALAVGIGASLITMTIYHSRSGHPIWWKEGVLRAVTLDMRSSDPNQVSNPRHPEYPPFQLTYRDAKALYASDIPVRQVRMFMTWRLIEPPSAGVKPFGERMRVTTADFFAMFDAPFLYGGGWTRAADEAPEAVVVIGRKLNHKLFGGANSVGKSIRLNGRDYRVVGVLDAWAPQPRYYDLGAGGIEIPEEIYLPFGWTEPLELLSNGSMICMSAQDNLDSYQNVLNSQCVWLQYWVELASSAQSQRYQQFVDNYVTDQKRSGRFPRPLNNRIVKVSEWLNMNNVIGDETRLQVALALLFLAVCVLNTLGLMLAKFLGHSAVTGLRRALGASRRDIMRQHVIEVVVLSLVAGVAGIGVALGGLWALRTFLYLPLAIYSDVQDRAQVVQSMGHLDGDMLLLALGVSLITGLLAALYPAWRIGRMPPAAFLKAQ